MINMPGKSSTQRRIHYISILATTLLALFSLACILDPFLDMVYTTYKQFIKEDGGVNLLEPGQVVIVGGNETEGEAYLGEETSGTVTSSGENSFGDYGDLKPVGFVNYGEFDATVRAQSFIPLGSSEGAPPPAASTVSSANDGVGEWPNSSRFISVPMGAYSWCIEWEERDLDEDGQIDYFHYIQNDPTVLDENDSDELDLAEEVAIMAPPSAAPIYSGKCEVDVDTQYVWMEIGVGDYIGMDVDSSEGPIPDDAKAMPGVTAICWDNVEHIHFSEKAWCTYKSVDWQDCLDGPYKGKMYIAVEAE